MVEPWLRGTLTEVDAVRRAVLHALQLTREDIDKWCSELSDAELNARPHDLPSVAFHLRHIARSLDRLITYAEGNQLVPEQIAAMKAELEPGAVKAELFTELNAALNRSVERVLAIRELLETVRGVGRQQLPTSVGGLLIHVADHTQRHVGQAITTAKIVTAMRG